jgi:hypothetical protein
MHIQPLGMGQGGGQEGGSDYVTAADFKAMEEKKKQAKELAAAQEKLRLEDDEKNFSYQKMNNPGLTWDALNAAVVSTSYLHPYITLLSLWPCCPCFRGICVCFFKDWSEFRRRQFRR